MASGSAGKPESIWLNLLFNAVVPAVVLSTLSSPQRLGPLKALLLALASPLVYGAWDLAVRKTWNFLSAVGLVGTLVTGGLGLLQLGGFWFAVKEAAVPVVLGLAIPLSLQTRQPLVKTLLFNEHLLNVASIHQALHRRGTVAEFERLLAWASWMLALTLVASAGVNFGLAIWLLPAESGTEDFNRQLAKLQVWSWPGTFIPITAGMFYALYKVLKGLEQLTGMPSPEFLHPKKPRPR